MNMSLTISENLINPICLSNPTQPVKFGLGWAGKLGKCPPVITLVLVVDPRSQVSLLTTIAAQASLLTIAGFEQLPPTHASPLVLRGPQESRPSLAPSFFFSGILFYTSSWIYWIWFRFVLWFREIGSSVLIREIGSFFSAAIPRTWGIHFFMFLWCFIFSNENHWVTFNFSSWSISHPCITVSLSLPLTIYHHRLCFLANCLRFLSLHCLAILQFYLDFGKCVLHDAYPSLRTLFRWCLNRKWINISL